MRVIFFSVFFIFFHYFAFSQQVKEKKLIQFSGVVVSADSLVPVPFVNIIIKGTNHGTVSDYYGYFSFVAQESDIINFSALGYKASRFAIPDSMKENRYSLIQVMNSDTVMLKESVIYPWPTREQFKKAFLTTNIPDDDLERARKNLARSEMKEMATNLPMDGAMNQKFIMQQTYSKLYYAGQLPPNNLLNPLAWAQFVKAWKRGDFVSTGKEKQEEQEDDYAR